MATDPLDLLRGYLLDNAGASPLPPSDLPEERAPDLPTATSSSPAQEMARLEIDPFPEGSALFRFFVDGVQRTVPVAEILVNKVRVPLHLSHLIVGAMERADRELRPFKVREALVLLLPYQALQVADSAWSSRRPPGRELGSAGRIYEAVQSGKLLYSDTSLTLRLGSDGRPGILLQAGDLIRTGEVRRKALDRAKELLRIMEIGILWELRQECPENWILLDGPVAPPLKYGRLVAPALQGLEEIARPDIAFDFLRRVVGAVKRVQIVPQSGLEVALSSDKRPVLPIYRFGEVIEEDDAVTKEILSAFLWLRRELAGEISALWSTVSGLARIDIPIPAVFDDPARRNGWNTLDERDITDLLADRSSAERQRLEEILRSIVTERWPVPASTVTRMLVELFPIAETELWLTAQLRTVYEMRSVFSFSHQ
ncbi:hypothetical protein NET02_00890 [Thermomicrobiaceae bacterium CFH 74404]|uniref:Uncharacterized protein n=1 Tax=Thermalbibacter longus TaxID=2951981 RepID=A0AA41WDY8_9BACT|nr:hypothetical protein [Thermalbibacter longus]MCM8747696.1 hypothetical protein [Thermalbibacter longus]